MVCDLKASKQGWAPSLLGRLRTAAVRLVGSGPQVVSDPSLPAPRAVLLMNPWGLQHLHRLSPSPQTNVTEDVRQAAATAFDPANCITALISSDRRGTA
jgi:hypothetical protein